MQAEALPEPAGLRVGPRPGYRPGKHARTRPVKATTGAVDGVRARQWRGEGARERAEGEEERAQGEMPTLEPVLLVAGTGMGRTTAAC